ncbi:MAG TPA: Re/Si-specific NAD(P)(+) transhydrogenase subunit alpha [Phycisphaerae bacterium]|nr:Re/Si-specific NAD(P)(+) transhydrogenase subunit alpha [Phycisphaerae bacterium]HON65851.1 Re/Si-specific NAD(P)(+) transhydrogenase subunit alpha [Phycisphaerae bacterium]HPP24967.1 Re/Si-specific NAD(P)(+) transhydrogenase subunit alpha [Phycisphaerae bacterium]HPU28191.1 Re/Si-specific NAD(P)(+) transhydrogenase subunit alpha [Phycisphaerae bacterium]
MRVGVVRETFPGERRVALVPGVLASLKKAGLEVLIESQAGAAAGFTDAEYQEKGATVVADRAEVLRQADVLLQVRTLGANPEAGPSDLEHLRSGQTLIGLADPLIEAAAAGELARRGVNLFAMELIPRITRAQSMDVLSSMASIAGYKAVLLAAAELPKLFPMMMTAAGTITPAKVFVIGAGVAGLQAIATAQRLGAIVHGYDLRPAVKEQVQSLGAKFVELDVAAADAEAKGGYAKAMDEDFYRRQREAMARVVADMDVVITTAAVPGQKAPVLITREMLTGMRPGSVVLDLAAERGGNCEATVPGETVQVGGVSVLGPVNLPATVPFHASQMYAKNITTFLLHVVKNGELQLTADDEITRETLVVRDGQVVHPRVKERLEA